MGRRAKFPDEASVTFIAPRVLLDQIEVFAEEEFRLSRPDAIRTLIWRGILFTRLQDRNEQSMRELKQLAAAVLAGRRP